MSARQFANSLGMISRTEHTHRGRALARHLFWQARKLLPVGPVRRRISASTIVDDELGGVISMVNMLGCYDYNNMSLVQLLLARSRDAGDPAVFIDVGANIGAYSLIASEIPGAHVVSIEPIPATYAKLCRNLDLNGRHDVVTLNVGASRVPGTLQMTCDKASVLNQVVSGPSDQPTVSVPVDTMDAICARLGHVPTVVKIDVEGHEPEVLGGAASILPRCAAVLVENGERPAVTAMMRDSGMAGPFFYRHRTRSFPTSPQPVPEDAVFLGPGFAARFPDLWPDQGIDAAAAKR